MDVEDFALAYVVGVAIGCGYSLRLLLWQGHFSGLAVGGNESQGYGTAKVGGDKCTDGVGICADERDGLDAPGVVIAFAVAWDGSGGG